MHIIPIVVVGKDRRILIGAWGYLNRQHPLLKLPRGLLALCRWILHGGNKRHQYAIACPDKLRIDPIAVDGIDGRHHGKREEREETLAKHQIKPGYGE